jgi:predicted permease
VSIVIGLFIVAVLSIVIYLVVRGLVKYPEQGAKGGFPFNNSVPGAPPIMFDAEASKPPETPRLVVPSERAGPGMKD